MEPNLRTYLPDYQRRGIDFSVKDATVHNPFIAMNDVVMNLGVGHRLAFMPKSNVVPEGPTSYCALQNGACYFNSASIDYPIFPVSESSCDTRAVCHQRY